MYDVIIIGAGPAGTAAGFDLVSAGYSVLLLDRRYFPRKKACAGGITPKALDLFAYDISGFIEQTCYEVKVRRPGGRCFTVKDSRPLCYMTRRRDLDMFSLNKVVGAGGRFRKTGPISAVSQEEDHVAVHTPEGRLAARYLIGADGANSRVRQMAVRPRTRYHIRKCPALEADVYVNNAQGFKMEFDFSQGIPGYYWIFPKKAHVSIGIFAADRNVPMTARHLADYAARRLGTDRLRNIKGYPIGVDGRGTFSGRKPGAGRVLLAGDSAGVAEPMLGEGIYYALKSGQLAAAAIIRALEGGRPALTSYHYSMARVRLDLGLYSLGAGLLYRIPGPCLGLAKFKGVHGYFSRGYAAGRSLSGIVFPF